MIVLIGQIPKMKQDIDYDKVVSGAELDLATYKRKFELWDEVIHDNSLASTDSETVKRVYGLLSDPTIYAYAYFHDDDGSPFRMTAYQDAIVNCVHDGTELCPERFVLFKAANQIGKGFDTDELVQTPSGFKRIGDLVIGDYVYGMDGKKTKVIGFPYQGKLPLYKVTFDDGCEINVNKEHLWICKTSKERFRKRYTKGLKTWDNPSYNNWLVCSTEDIIQKGQYTPFPKCNGTKVSIPVTLPVELPEKVLPIDPYVLGLLIGDGSLVSGVSFCTGDKEIKTLIDSKYDNTLKYRFDSGIFSGTLKNLNKYVRSLGLLGKHSDDKFIPIDYLNGSIYQRRELLKGLMDTDGSVYGNHSTLEYCTVSSQLKTDFVELVNSLGGLVNSVTEKKPFYYTCGRNKKVFCKKAYSIRFKVLFNPFRLSRKYKLWKPVTKYRHERIIEKIEKLDKFGDIRCIAVDNSNGSFLVTKDYIVTHNSKLLCLMAIYHAFNEENVNVVMVSKSLPQSQFLLAQIRHTLNNSKFADTWRENIGDTANTTVLTFKREYKDKDGKLTRTMTNRIICAPMGEGLLGYPVHYLYLDELDFYEDAQKFFWKIALPRTNKTKGQIIGFSNPNPDMSRNSSLLWDLWTGNLFRRKFSFNFLDAPWNTRLEYDMVKKSSPSYIFASTHDGEFPKEGGGFFKYIEIQDMMQKDWVNQLPIVDRPVYIGLDLAKVRDQSVMVIGTCHKFTDSGDDTLQEIRIHYIKSWEVKTDYDAVIDELKQVIDLYQMQHHGVASVGFDATGVGKAVEDIMKMKTIKATPIDFNLQSKSRMYGNFKMLAEQRRIKIVYDSECEDQLSKLIFDRTPRGYLTVRHEKESDFDDYPDAIVCLIDVALNLGRVTPTVKFIDTVVSTGTDGPDKVKWVTNGTRPVSDFDMPEQW